MSGGQGKGEVITEAEAMADYLQNQGIEKMRIYLEDRSRTTQQNLEFSETFLEKKSIVWELYLIIFICIAHAKSRRDLDISG